VTITAGTEGAEFYYCATDNPNPITARLFSPEECQSEFRGAGTIAAIGYAKQNNRLRMMAVTSSIGPGDLNMVAATANRLPVLFLPGDAYASRQPAPVLRQIERPHDYTTTASDAFRAVSRYWDRVNRPEQLMTAMLNAFRVLTDPADTGGGYGILAPGCAGGS
jgi:TPP-dependent trihydroxycyclohexane-1,2-dione (THcHDO) dehydratase